jgi:hypothetical protein
MKTVWIYVVQEERSGGRGVEYRVGGHARLKENGASFGIAIR